jgi:hypothetical protein
MDNVVVALNRHAAADFAKDKSASSTEILLEEKNLNRKFF